MPEEGAFLFTQIEPHRWCVYLVITAFFFRGWWWYGKNRRTNGLGKRLKKCKFVVSSTKFGGFSLSEY